MTMAAIVVWCIVGAMAYTYMGYPLLLWVLVRLRDRRVRPGDATPSATLIISAFNEKDAIAEKLANALATDYPAGALEILVVSDASTDGTDRIVEGFSGQGVKLLRMAERRGKTAGLNAAVAGARGEILVFSDANILYQTDAIRRLVRNFSDPSVGCVTGDSRYVDPGESAAHQQESTYWNYERIIRTLESHVGSTVGGDGAIFAIRRTLYSPLPADAINDLVTPLQIVARGFRAVFEPGAVGCERSAGVFAGEFRRKRRIVNRSWRGVMSHREVLNPWRVGLFAWQVWSHKVLRWWMLPLMVLALVACLIANSMGRIFQVATGAFLLSLVLAAVGGLLPDRRGRLVSLAQSAFYFYLVNIASVLGLLTAMFGRADTVWTPER